MSNTTTNRRTHRKKASNLRLSSDTTSTLPEYLPVAVWARSPTTAVVPGGGAATGGVEDDTLPEDRPPDYSDSAEEADEDTDTERSKFTHSSTQPHGANYQSLGGGKHHIMAPLPVRATAGYQPPISPTPWRRKRYGHGHTASISSFQHHRRKHPSTSGVMSSFHTPAPSFSSTSSGLPLPPPSPPPIDPYLDSLLERSVHALEMSNTLLQTSMSTEPSLSNILGPTPEMPTTRPTSLDYNIERRARGLEYRLQDTRDRHEAWLDELEELTRGVDSLFDEEPRRGDHGYHDGHEYGEGRRDSWKRYSSHSMEGSISSSMPTTSPISQHPPALAPGLERSSSTSSRHLRSRRKPSLELQRHHPSHAPAHHPKSSLSANNHRLGHSDSFEARVDISDSRLRYGAHQHTNLVAPPPRALTQYVTATTTEEPEEGGNRSLGDSWRKTRIDLPSTLGLKASASSHLVPKPSSEDFYRGGGDEIRERGGAVSRASNASSGGGGGLANSANVNFHAAPSSPRITRLHSQPTTPAYNMLSSFVQKQSTAPPEPPATPPSTAISSTNPALAAVASISAFITRSRRGSSASANGNSDAPQVNSSGNVPTSNLTLPRTQQATPGSQVRSRSPSRRLSVPVLVTPSPSRRVTNYSAGSSPAAGVGFEGNINGGLHRLKAGPGSYNSKQWMNFSIAGSPNTATTVAGASSMSIRHAGEIQSGQELNISNAPGDIRVEEEEEQRTSKSLSSGYVDGTNNVTLPPSTSSALAQSFTGSVRGNNNSKDMSHRIGQRDTSTSLAHSVLPVSSSDLEDSVIQHQLPLHSQSPKLAQSHSPVSRQRSQDMAVTMSSPPPIYIPTTSKMVIRRTLSPTEEEEGEEKASLSESSSDGCRAKMTVVSLRKILDEQDQIAAQQQQQSPDQRRISASPSPSRSAHSPSRGRRTPNSLLSTSHLKPPPLFLMPLVPAPAVEAGTSNATASVSRLLTKNLHTASTRPPSPPRQSAMKRSGSVQQVPQVGENGAANSQDSRNGEVTSEAAGEGSSGNGLRLATAVGLMVGVMNSVKRATSVTPSTLPNGAPRADGTTSPNGVGSASGSGRSTPKRISFAELPESYASTRPEGSARFRELKKQSRRKSKSGLNNGGRKGKKGESLDDELSFDGGGWLSKFLVGAGSASAASGPGGPVHGLTRNGTEERYEERMGRSGWGGGGRFPGMGMSGSGSGLGPGFGSAGFDEWSV